MSKFHSLCVASVARETRDAIAVSFVVPGDLQKIFEHAPGQHLTLRAELGGQDIRRSYSICSAPHEKQLRIAIKRVADGVFSSWANEHLQAGASLDVLAPIGHFHVPLDGMHARHYVAFAAGSGITPILSILKATLNEEPRSRFTLVYGNRASSSVLFKEELADLKDRYLERLNLIFVLSREQQDIDLFNGRIDRAKVDELLRVWIDCADIDTAFLCGPLEMMQAVRESLEAHGLGKTRIRTELFAASAAQAHPAARAHPAPGANECEVSVIQDGRTTFFRMQKNHDSVLDAALEQGLELPYSCKTGVCSTCRCKRVGGEVDMDANFALEDYEIARGFILPCQSYPVSDKLVLDYDQDT
jgi:ring-1,2-phenylacetyl-CoA epoxidase subunit PaaE